MAVAVRTGVRSSNHSLAFLSCLAQLALLTVIASNAPDLPDSGFFKDVVAAIEAKEKWDEEAEIRVSKFDGETVRVGTLQKYEFHVRAVKKVWALKFSDEVNPWKKLEVGAEGFGSAFFAGDVGFNRRISIKPFELEGPVELVTVGDGDLSLQMPLNTTHVGFSRIVIGDGIKIKVEGAQEVTFILPPDSGFLLNKSSMTLIEHRTWLWPEQNSKCPPLLSVYIHGPASVTAYKIQDPRASVETSFSSPDTVELLSETIYDGDRALFHPLSSIQSLSSRLVLLEKILKSFLGDKISHGATPNLIKVKITSSILVKFCLELERDVGADDKIWKKAAPWKTRPLVERTWFEIVARVEEGKVLKLVTYKKLKRPFVIAETTALSSLLSNISFTKIPAVVVPPEPLTLDVKW